ncbi:MAG: hypothetical protein PHI31_05760 [Desulfuromonadaceae bacterium]|nr:hypothetical protein [Desulfuromonadaceae bacterium]
MEKMFKVVKNHPFMKLGKNPAVRDTRNIKLAAVLRRALPPVPEQWDFDLDFAKGPIPTPVFANDWLGDCVIAGRAHMTLRFEYFEQSKTILKITDNEVVKEYQREGGSMVEGEQGLNMLTSLKSWRKDGWKAARRKYKIHAFVELDPSNIQEVKVAIHQLTGTYIGLSLPNCFQEQMERGLAWDLVPGPAGKPNPKQGHCVYVCGYTAIGPVCITWGKKQQMTWKFFTACCDEAYAIVDERDRFVKKSPVDLVALESILQQLG